MPTLRVSAGSRPNAVAGAIAAILRLEGAVEMQAIGPHAVNQAVKSLAIARAYLVQDELDLLVAPGFVKLELHDEERTAMRFQVQSVPLDTAHGLGATPTLVERIDAATPDDEGSGGA
jgi:stage V sporulation protein S